MKRRSDGSGEWDALRDRIIGLGEKSIKKSYYPELRQRLDDLELFRTLLDQSLDAIFLARVPAGALADVNETACRRLGYSREELMSKSLSDLIAPPESERIDTVLNEQADLGLGFSFTVSLLKKDGNSIPAEMTLRLVELRGTAYAVAVIRDITERKEAQDRLKNALRQLENIIEFLPDATFIIDRDKRIIAWNRAMEEMTGVPKEDILGRDHLMCAVPFYGEPRAYLMDLVEMDDEEIASKYDFVRRRGKGLYAEVFAPALYGGRGAYIWAIASPLYDSDGNVTGIIESIRDINDHKLAQEALKDSEGRYRSLFENALEGIFQTTLDGRIIMINPALARMVGYDSPGHAMSRITDIATQVYENPEDRNDIIKNLQREGSVLGREVLFKRFDGKHIKVMLNLVLMKDNKGRGSYIEGSCIDITEKWLAEEALKASEARFRRLYDSMRDAFVSVSMDGTIRECNDVYLDMLGYGADEIRRLTYRDITPEKWHTFEAKIIEKEVLTRGYSDIFQKEYRRKDGTIFPVELRTYLMRDDEGKPAAMWAIVRDITERKQAEEALKESERHLAEIIEFLPDATMVIDSHGRVTAWNKAMEAMTGVAATDMIGKGNYEYAIPFYGKRRPVLIDLVLMTKEEVERKYYRIIRRGDLLIGETDVPVVRGQKRFLSGWAHPIYDASGQVLGAIESIRDITEKRRAEEALAESEARYRLLAENASDIIFTMDNDLRFTYISPSVERIRGFTVEEAMNQSIEQVLTPLSLDEATRVFQEEMEKEKAGPVELWRKRTLELEEFCRDGSTIWTETTFTPLRDKEKRFSGLLGITRDITERKKAALEKSRLEEQLTQAQKMESIGTLAGGIAHDFNNILAAIIGYSELAIDDMANPDKARSEIGEVIKAGDRAKDLVSQILTFSRKTETSYSPLALRTIVKESLKMLRSVIPTTIEIRHDLADSGLIMSDPTQINQILLNLCTNAAHAMDEPGGVLGLKLNKVAMESDAACALGILPGPYLKLTVSDTGHGMPPEVIERIFEPYFTTKEIGRGTGLGLSVVHGIVKSHGGSITCSSTPGAGTTFEVYFPEVDSVEKRAEGYRKETYQKGTERILFVDDEPSLVKLAENLLGKIGYKVLSKTDSREALDVFRENPDRFDLVITDMTMPGMAGDMLAEKLLEIRGDISIILCTGFSERISEEKAKKIGVKAFVLKPFEIKEMARTIRKVLDAGE